MKDLWEPLTKLLWPGYKASRHSMGMTHIADTYAISTITKTPITITSLLHNWPIDLGTSIFGCFLGLLNHYFSVDYYFTALCFIHISPLCHCLTNFNPYIAARDPSLFWTCRLPVELVSNQKSSKHWCFKLLTRQTEKAKLIQLTKMKYTLIC